MPTSDLIARVAELEARVAALEVAKPRRRLNRERCKWISDGKGGRFVLPGCWGSVHRNDMSGCYCKKYLED